MLRPILNMRPKFRYRTLSCPARFPADLYLVDWLDQKGIDVDYLTDHDLHAEGADLLRPYTVVVVELAPRVLDAPGCSTRWPTTSTAAAGSCTSAATGCSAS